MSCTIRDTVAAVASAILITCIACTLTPSPAAAALADLRGGVYTDQGGLALGGGVIQRMAIGTSWYFNPNLEAAFDRDQNVVSLNADVHYDFPTATPYSIYAGAGPAVIVTDPEHGDSRTNGGLNLLGGVNWRQATLRPFVQMKGVLSDQGQLSIMGGVRF